MANAAPPLDTESGLLRLPAEIRNCIYEYALVEDEPIHFQDSIQDSALTRINRQVRAEALSIYYGSNVFQQSRWTEGTLKAMKKLSPGKFAMLKHLRAVTQSFGDPLPFYHEFVEHRCMQIWSIAGCRMLLEESTLLFSLRIAGEMRWVTWVELMDYMCVTIGRRYEWVKQVRAIR